MLSIFRMASVLSIFRMACLLAIFRMASLLSYLGWQFCSQYLCQVGGSTFCEYRAKLRDLADVLREHSTHIANWENMS